MTLPLCARILPLALILSAAACDIADSPRPRRDTTSPRDTTPPRETTADTGPASCDPAAGPGLTGCPADQYCETTALMCVDCVSLVERCAGDPARPTRQICDPPRPSGPGQVRGGFFRDAPCAWDEVCTQTSPTRTSCDKVICEPNIGVCLSGSEAQRCNPQGTAEITEQCSPGFACYDGRCDVIRHNIILIFDTSSSMWSYIDPAIAHQSAILCEQNQTPCMAPFPACEGDTPLTIFTLSKQIFASTIRQTLGGFSQFALMRFPQRDAPRAGPTCFNGFYTAQTELTGDDGTRDTAASSWFTPNLGESVVVPFPVRTSLDNRETLLSWLDNREALGATSTPCQTNDDCGPLGRCGQFNQEKRCFEHSDPELRAIGQTPLGKSLFYAGEYLRTKVRVDGKACTVASDCDSAGYICHQGHCADPYRRCKNDYIILFTDGEESVFQNETEFFNPVVQAKRLAFGLDCQDDADCRGGATCQANICLAPDQAGANLPVIDSQGFSALASPDGQPISIQTTVITLNQSLARNARIARAGGGPNIVVSTTDPEAFRFELRRAMTPNPKCTPDDLE